MLCVSLDQIIILTRYVLVLHLFGCLTKEMKSSSWINKGYGDYYNSWR